MPWTMRRVSLRVRLLVAAACLLSLLFFVPRAQAAVERMTFGGQVSVDLGLIHNPADTGENPTWAWDSETQTLSLDGYNGPEIAFYSGTGSDTVTVVFAGNNAMQARDGHGLSANCNLTLRAASFSTQDRLTCRGGGAHGAGIIAQSGTQGKLTIESGVVIGYGAFLDGADGVGGAGIQAQQIAILEGARAVGRGGDGGTAGGMGLYTTGLLELSGRGARLDALGGHAQGTGGDGVVCAGAKMQTPNTALYTTGGDGAQPGNGLRHTAGYAFELGDGYLTAAPGNATTGAAPAYGVVTAGNFRVAGGTHLITGGIQSPQYGLVISGGSLRTAAADIVDAEGHAVVPTDALGNKVYLTRPAVSGGAWAEIDTIYFRRDPPGGYNTTGVVANSVGRLFLWLPSGTAISGVASGMSQHSIEPALVTSEDNGARGNIYATTSEDGQLLALSGDEDGPLAVMSEHGTTSGQLTQPGPAVAQAAEATKAPVEKKAPQEKKASGEKKEAAGASADTVAARRAATLTAKPQESAAPGGWAAWVETAAQGTQQAQESAAPSGWASWVETAAQGMQQAQESAAAQTGALNTPNPANQQLAGQQLANGATYVPRATVTPTAKPTAKPTEQVPPTGDTGYMALWMGLLGIALAGMWVLRKKGVTE